MPIGSNKKPAKIAGFFKFSKEVLSLVVSRFAVKADVQTFKLLLFRDP